MNVVALAFVALFAVNAMAVEPNERLADPALEARARDVSQALRCVVCQNETIDESNAELAKDMRMLVRERIAAGDSNQEVLDYMVARYGDFVLLKPRFNGETIVLWLGPLLLFGAGAAAVLRRVRKASDHAPTVAPLSDAEQKELAALSGTAPPERPS
ncbi:MAG: cytochrome c-type biogenesis protein CcmH [Rhodobacteraceae bacterium]|nr:cytochrome c-type biogenesis protein CcmH [Paracoccaceae bacterium]